MQESDRLNFKPRTQVLSLTELARFLDDQMIKDEMSVVVSFFENSQIVNREDSYLSYLSAGGVPQNCKCTVHVSFITIYFNTIIIHISFYMFIAMVAFALCTDFDTARALKIPPPLPRSVAFSPSPGESFKFEMRQAKFFENGQVFLDGVLPILAFIETGDDPKVTFPATVKEAMLGAGKGSMTEDGEL